MPAAEEVEANPFPVAAEETPSPPAAAAEPVIPSPVDAPARIEESDDSRPAPPSDPTPSECDDIAEQIAGVMRRTQDASVSFSLRCFMRTLPGPSTARQLIWINAGPHPLSAIRIRLGGACRHWDQLASGHYILWPWPTGGRESFSARFTEHGQRHVVGYCWEDIQEDQAVVAIQDAGTVKRVVLDVEAHTPAPLVKVKGAADIEDLLIRYRHHGNLVATWQGITPSEIDCLAPHCDELEGLCWQEIVFMRGPEITLGRSRSASWHAFCRDEAGQPIALNPARQMVRIADYAGKDRLRHLTSRLHATLRWDGGETVEIMNGIPGKPSSRNVFVCGVMFDDDWCRLTLPATFTLGPPESNHVAVQLVACRTATNKAAICLREQHPQVRRIAWWIHAASVHYLARGHGRNVYPAFSEWDADFALDLSQAVPLLTSLDSGHSQTIPATGQGIDLAAHNLPYMISRNDQGILVRRTE